MTSGPDLSITVDGIRFPNPFVIGSGPPGTNYKVRGFRLLAAVPPFATKREWTWLTTPGEVERPCSTAATRRDSESRHPRAPPTRVDSRIKAPQRPTKRFAFQVMKKAFDEGWGGVICKTLSLDSSKVVNVTPRYAKMKGLGGEVRNLVPSHRRREQPCLQGAH